MDSNSKLCAQQIIPDNFFKLNATLIAYLDLLVIGNTVGLLSTKKALNRVSMNKRRSSFLGFWLGSNEQSLGHLSSPCPIIGKKQGRDFFEGTFV